LPVPIEAQSEENLKQTIREILVALSDETRVATLTDTDDLFGTDIIDSFGVLQLIAAIEDKLRVAIPEHELIPQNLWSVASICELVRRVAAAAP
jgi:acyl carrier protein